LYLFVYLLHSNTIAKRHTLEKPTDSTSQASFVSDHLLPWRHHYVSPVLFAVSCYGLLQHVHC